MTGVIGQAPGMGMMGAAIFNCVSGAVNSDSPLDLVISNRIFK
jgi:hypothetical protein